MQFANCCPRWWFLSPLASSSRTNLGLALIGHLIPEDETHHLGPSRRGEKRPPLQFPLLETKEKRTPSLHLPRTPVHPTRCPAGLRWVPGRASAVPAPRPPGTPGGTDRRRAGSRPGSAADWACSAAGGSKSEAFSPAPQRPGQRRRAACWTGAGRAGGGRAARPGSLALGRESAIGAEPARRPAPDSVPRRGAPRRVEKNSGGCDDSARK